MSERPSSNRAAKFKGMLKIFAVLIVLALCIFVILPVVTVGVLHWKSETTISNTEQQEIDWVVSHAYPNSTMVRADSNVTPWPTGDTVNVAVLITFESADSFDTVKTWYVKHPEGGWGGGLNDNIFPREGLEKLQNSAPDKTRYRVSYVQTLSCEDFLGCDRPLQQIR